MSGNINNNERSMNGIISINAEDLKVNTLDANNINVSNLEIENSLLVNTTTITPNELEQINGINTNETIQQQINNINTNISNNLVTTNTPQTIVADKTLTGNLIVDNINISPTEISYLDGLTDNIQTQLENAGISNAMTLNTDQLATGQKTFSQPVGLPAIRLDNQTGSFQGYFTDATNLIYQTAPPIVIGTSRIVGEGVNSLVLSQTTRIGNNNGILTLEDNSTPTTPSYNTDGYLSNRIFSTRKLFVFKNVTNIQQFLTGIKWNSTSSVTIPEYIDDYCKSINGYDVTMANSDNLFNVNPNFTTNTGYIRDINTFIQKPYTGGSPPPPIPLDNFLEGSGLNHPVEISSRNNFSYTITSPNTITPTLARGSISGYIDDTETIYYSSSLHTPLLNYQSFVKGICSPETMILSAVTSDKKYDIRFNSVVPSANFTKGGYIIDASNIVFENNNDIQLNQFVNNNTYITKGKHYITAITDRATLGDINTPLTPTPSTSINGYLFTNNIVVGTGFTLNNFVTNTDIPDVRTNVSVVNPTFVNLSTTNNIPTPNNKTYNGFSVSSTEFYYNNDDTNVAIDYYLKDNDIVTPTTNHLITAVDIPNKKLTTANLPISTPIITTNGYVNTNLNKIITETSQSVNVGDGIDTTLIDTSSRFVTSVNGLEIGISGTLNSQPQTNDIDGYTKTSNEVIAYDPNNRLVVNNFLLSDNASIPINAKITTIIPLNDNFKQINFSPTGGSDVVFNTFPSYKPSTGTIYINNNSFLNKIYSFRNPNAINSNNTFGKLTQLQTNGTYTTTDTTGLSNNLTLSACVNILLSNGTRAIFFGANNVNLQEYANRLFYLPQYANFNNFLVPLIPPNTSIQNALVCSNPVNTNSYFDFNKGTTQSNPNLVSNSLSQGYLYFKDGYYFYINNNVTSYFYRDFIFDRTGFVNNSLVANTSGFTGMWIDNQTTGTAVNIGFKVGNPPNPIYSTSAERGSITIAGNYNSFVTSFNAYNSSPYMNPVGGEYLFQGSGTSYDYARITGYTDNGNGTTTLTLDRAFFIGKIGDLVLNLFQKPVRDTFSLRSTQNANFIEEVLLFYPQPSHQTQYESITPTNINFYRNFDSYNSYEKKTFQDIPSIQFDLFNSVLFEEIEQVADYNAFERLNFIIYNELGSFVSQTSTDMTFPTNNNTDDVIVLQDTFQILQNKFIRDLAILDNLQMDDTMRINVANGLDIFQMPTNSPTKLMNFNGQEGKITLFSNPLGDEMVISPTTIQTPRFRVFKPVDNNAGGFGFNNTLVRVLTPANIVFNGGTLMIFFSVSCFAYYNAGLATFTLEFKNSSNQIVFQIPLTFYFNQRVTHAYLGCEVTIIPTYTSSTGYFALRRSSNNFIQDANDFTNVTIIEFPF